MIASLASPQNDAAPSGEAESSVDYATDREDAGLVLVVDDVLLNLHQVRDILTGEGYRVEVAMNGLSALRIAENVHPDLVLLDVVMPDMDGFETCRWMKKIGSLKEVPVIFLSANDSPADKLRGFASGGVDYIIKPFQKEEVIARVRTHVALRKMQVSLQKSCEDMEDQVRRRTLEAQQLFSLAVEQSSSSIAITDDKGVIKYVNNKFSELTGYSRHEAMGKDLLLLRAEDQPAEAYLKMKQTVQEGQQWYGELHSQRKDETLFWAQVTVSPITAKNEKAKNYLVVIDDITFSKEARRQLQANQAELMAKHAQLTNMYQQLEHSKVQWEQTMDCIDDIILLVDNKHRIQRCNKALLQFAGIADYDTVLGGDWQKLFRANQLDVESAEAELYHTPSSRWFTMKRYPYVEGGGAVIAFHEITALKQVSDELANAYEELKTTHRQLLHQEKMASIGQLAAGVAHEINNPIGFISSNLETLEIYAARLKTFVTAQDEALTASPSSASLDKLAKLKKSLKVEIVLEDIPKLINESKDGTERVKSIVSNLKGFARVDDAQMEPTDLNECLDKAVAIAWNELKYKGTLERDYGDLPVILCHPHQLAQVFLNFLVNAAQSIEGKGAIILKTWRKGDIACIAITDTGCGIPAENLNRIFEPFFTTKEVGKGTGLGLSISYEIIESHGGTIEVVSEVGKGTTFTVLLPIRKK